MSNPIQTKNHATDLDTCSIIQVHDNQEGAVHALQQFSGNFAKSAELLVSEGNFILNRLDNLDRVIDYYADHKTALQAEFGSGDAAKPTGQIAQALETYNQTYGI